MMVWDSVFIDWENKQIVCHLPLRGKEEEFLSNNRYMALKILDQQCYKYKDDEDTKGVIVKAFQKLLKNKQMVFWKDLTEEERKLVESKAINHYIVWRVVFKPSLSTPARPVFDASQRTKLKSDGSGGRCLNDLVVKGRVVTLNLVKMVLRFVTGQFAVQGDLKQFYASIKLVSDQWHLQRVLYKEELNPDGEIQEAIIKTLIWGIKSVSAQSECSIIKLATHVKEKYPLLADFLLNGRFVDDLGDSSESLTVLKKMTAEADMIFEKVGLGCKGWSFSGAVPPSEVCEENESVSIGGMRWITKPDLLEVPVPPLHFSKKVRGRLSVGTEVFDGNFADLENFVPKKLTRTMIFSKNNAFFDLLGKFVPISAGFKLDIRAAVQATQGWNDPVPEELRTKWIKNFWRLERLRGIKFERARMPSNAVSSEMDLIVAGDAAEHLKIVGAWARFRLNDGKFSSQLLIGRSILASEDSTIPKDELDALTMASNLCWILRQALVKWVVSYIVIGDSTISMCWVTSKKKRLSLFHRNRTVQIRRGVDLDKLYHVVSKENPADCGTRPSTVKDDQVGPDSNWERGMEWMRGEIDDAITEGILTPVEKLRVSDEDEETYRDGFVFEKSQEILTRGHSVSLLSRVDQVKLRAESAKYLLSPSKYKFVKTVRIMGMVFRFLKSFKCLKERFARKKESTKFQMFVTLKASKSSIDEESNEEENDIEEVKLVATTAIITIRNDDDKKQVLEVFDKNYIESNVKKLPEGETIVDLHRIHLNKQEDTAAVNAG